MSIFITAMGRRGLALLTFGALDVAWALRLATVNPSRTEFYTWLHSACPLTAIALAWLAVGILCLAQAFLRDKTIAFRAAMFIKVVWAILYLCGWMTGILVDGWASAITWIAFAITVAIISGLVEVQPEKVGAWIRRQD